MSEDKKTKTVTLKTIPLDKTITLEISGFFHKRLLALYFNYVSQFETEKFEKILRELSKDEIDKIKDEKEQSNVISLQTLLILIDNSEKAFTDAGYEQDEKFEIPIEDSK